MDTRTPIPASQQPLAMSSRQNTSASAGLRMLRTAIGAACYFVFYFVQQMAELFAPLLLIAGAAWAALPALVKTLTRTTASADPQAHDAIASVANTIPEQIVLAGHELTASGLICDGLGLMAVAAAGATLAMLVGRKL